MNVKQTLINQITEFVDRLSQNGIAQHSAEWHAAKTYTIGGSQIATLMGKNHFSSVSDIILSKIGVEPRRSSMIIHWGLLFEQLNKRYVEHDKSTKIIGSDIFVPGPPNTSYSPDGLAVIEREPGKYVRALLEFKCPFSRVPDGRIPQHYVPQVKFGLDILREVTDIGLFVDAVFRRCLWGDLGRNPHHDRKLVDRAEGIPPLAYGFIGFYLDVASAKQRTIDADPGELARRKSALITAYKAEFEVGSSANKWMSNDLGEASVGLLEAVLAAYNIGILAPWYSEMIFVDDSYDESAAFAMITNELDKYEGGLEGTTLNFGILPYKLFVVQYNYIDREDGFVERWRPQIDRVINIVRKCMEAPPDKKMDVYNEMIASIEGGFSVHSSAEGFSDEQP